MDDNLSILIKAILDENGIKQDIKDLDKIAEKYTLNFKASIDKGELINSIKAVLPKIIADVNKAYNLKLPIDVDDKILDKSVNQYQSAMKKMASELNKIQLSFDDGTYEAKYDSLIAKTRQWLNANDESVISTKKLTDAYNEFNIAASNYSKNGTVENRDILIKKEEELSRQLKATTNDIRIQNAEWAKSSKIDSLHQQIQEFYDKNTATHAKWGAQLNSMLDETAHGAHLTTTRVSEIEQSFNGVQNAARQAGKLGNSFFGGIAKQASKFTQWVSVSSLMLKAFHSVKEVGSNVRELDDALTNISYTMDVSEKQLEKIGITSLQTAKDLNTSASNVLDAVKTYANANETAESILNKAKPTIMMSNVTGMNTEDTVNILQGTMEQFDLTEDKLMHISDVMQTVSMSMPYDFAKGVKELSEGIQVSGSVAKDAGYDLENYTALLGTLIAKTRQSGSELGRSLRTMFVRTTKASSSALANGEVTEDDLSNAEAALRRVGIEVRSDINTFKSFDETMGELYEKVDSLSEVDLSNIAYEVASTRQTNAFKMMVKSYGDYKNMAEKAYDADGATITNQEKYAESLTGKLTKLSTIWEKIGDDAVSSDFLKGLTDIGIGASELIEKFGLLKTAIVGIGAYAGFKNVG